MKGDELSIARCQNTVSPQPHASNASTAANGSVTQEIVRNIRKRPRVDSARKSELPSNDLNS